MTNQSEVLAKLPAEQQVELLRLAARITERRSVKGNRKTRF